MEKKVELIDGTKAREEDIKALEEFLGGELPKTYIDFLSKYDGAVPSDNYITAESMNDGYASIRKFVPVLKIIQLTKDIDFIFQNTFPIAEDDCGNFICLDIRNGHILFWDHEISYSEEDEIYLAEDISQLLSQLVSFPIDNSDLDISGAKIIYSDPEFMEQQRKLGNYIESKKSK